MLWAKKGIIICCRQCVGSGLFFGNQQRINSASERCRAGLRSACMLRNNKKINNNNKNTTKDVEEILKGQCISLNMQTWKLEENQVEVRPRIRVTRREEVSILLTLHEVLQVTVPVPLWEHTWLIKNKKEKGFHCHMALTLFFLSGWIVVLTSPCKFR